MKTLCLSLLRLGDFFHHMHLLKNLEGDVQILAFDEVKPAAALYPQFKFHFIPRAQLQYELVEKHRNWRGAIDILGEQLRRVNAQHFELILNMTHTTFAARCADLLQAPVKKGLHFENGRVQGWNAILKYVNDIWKSEDRPLKNWVDVTALSLELPEPEIMDADVHLLAREIWLQPLTSDVRKNWAFTDWKDLSRQLSRAGFTVRVIGAMAEAEILKPVFGDQFVALNFTEMRAQKSSCRLLISGDTSVLHFAVLEKIPVHGIFLGPANAFKTAPRQKGAILWTQDYTFSSSDVAAAALADVHGLAEPEIEHKLLRNEQASAPQEAVPQGRENVETTRRGPHESAPEAGNSRGHGQEDARL